MRAPLRALLRAERGEVVLVAHSLGTVVAYDVLHELGAAARVRRFVTLGSPLGIEEVQDHLRQGPAARGGARATAGSPCRRAWPRG